MPEMHHVALRGRRRRQLGVVAAVHNFGPGLVRLSPERAGSATDWRELLPADHTYVFELPFRRWYAFTDVGQKATISVMRMLVVDRPVA